MMKQWKDGIIREVEDIEIPQEETVIQVTESELEQLIYDKICLILGVV